MFSDFQVPDPLYALVGLSASEARILRTPVFIRLHYLRQLGFAFLHFPGATSSRFEHSIGVLRNSYVIALALQARGDTEFRQEDLRTLRIAALLHDVGHGPFSHFFEKILRLLNRRVDQAGVSADIVREDAPLRDAIRQCDVDPDRVANIIDPSKKGALSELERLLATILSGDIDADRIDYLMRDCFFTGLPQSISADRTMRSLTYRELSFFESPRKELLIVKEAVELADALLMARLTLRQYVWTNPRNRAAEALVFRALTWAIDNAPKASPLRAINADALARRFREWTDDEFLAELHAAGGFAQQVVDRLIYGQLFEEALSYRYPELSTPLKEELVAIDKEPDKLTRTQRLDALERRYADLISQELGFEPEAVLLDFPELGSIQEVRQKVYLREERAYAPLTSMSSLAARISDVFRDYYTAHVFVRTWDACRGTRDVARQGINTIIRAPGVRP